MWIKVTPEKKRRNIIIYSIVSVLFATAVLLCGAYPVIAIGGAVLMFCALFFQIHLSETLPSF